MPVKKACPDSKYFPQPVCCQQKAESLSAFKFAKSACAGILKGNQQQAGVLHMKEQPNNQLTAPRKALCVQHVVPTPPFMGQHLLRIIRSG